MKKKVTLLLVMIITITNMTSVFAAKSISELTKEKNEIKAKSGETQKNLNETKEKKSGVLQEVEKLDRELSQVQEELEKLTNELETTKKNLNKSENDLEDAKVKKVNQYESLKKRMRVMYEDGSIGYLQIVLDSDGFTDFFKRLEYINRLIDYDQNVLNEYQKTEELITNTVEEIKEQKESIEVLSKQQETKKHALNESIQVKENLVKQLSADEATYLQQINDLDKADKDVTALIKKAQEEEAARKKAAAAAAAKARASKSSSSSSSSSDSGKVYSFSGGKMQYPVPAYRGVNSPYGYRASPISGRSEFHTGVDLKATMGTDVVSAADGTVIYAGNKGGYGKCVIVDHGDGISTLYAHNSRLVVSVGQSVKRGQVISKAGTTGYSTGVHLHFEVRINGKHTNPMPYIGG